MKRGIVFIIVFSSFGYLFAQNKKQIELDSCFSLIEKNTPIKANLYYLDSLAKVTQGNLQKQYLPSLSAQSKVSYQSDVVEISFPETMPYDIRIPSMPKDQYSITLDVSQMIYDGGMVENKSNLEDLKYSLQKEQVEKLLREQKELLARLYFSVLLADVEIEIFSNTADILHERIRIGKSSVQEGVVLQSELNHLKAELLDVEYKIEEARMNHSRGMKQVQKMLHIELPSGAELVPPAVEKTDTFYMNRSEMRIFDTRKQIAYESAEVVRSGYRPKVYGFGQAGYGKPGLNMLSDQFSPFYLVGMKASWKLWDWRQKQGKIKSLSIEREIAEKEQEQFMDAVESQEIHLRIAIEIQRKKIQYQKEALSLRKEIAREAKKQFDQGQILSIDYLTKLNKSQNAELRIKINELLLKKALVDLVILYNDMEHIK